MGFFSANCKGCDHPALCPQATNTINAWMTEIVAIMPNGNMHMGTYDGYGSVGTAEEAVGWNSTVWHRACWEVAGKPMEYQGESDSALDQGWFFDEGDHDMADPRVTTS